LTRSPFEPSLEVTIVVFLRANRADVRTGLRGRLGAREIAHNCEQSESQPDLLRSSRLIQYAPRLRMPADAPADNVLFRITDQAF
jgi:hypothetical protein